MADKPNVILIYADDLGRGMLSCYGQKHFNTPNIDKLCSGGLKFNYAYGCHVCAPARASLICGIHDCHAGRWTFTKGGVYIDYAKGLIPLEDVYELIHNTGIEQRSDDVFLPMVFTGAGYVTGQIGKLEWGFAATGDEIKAHGWDYHYGHYDHVMLHGYYPPFMFENGNRVDIPGNTDPEGGKGFSYRDPRYSAYRNDRSDKKTYSQDLYDQKIVEFITANKNRPFFLYHPSQIPHLALSIPQIDSRVKNHPVLNTSEQEYASMVLRLDDTVGLIRDTLEQCGIHDNTIIVFTSDNGHCFYYGQERNGCRLYYDAQGRFIDHLNIRYTTEGVGDIFDGNNGFTGCKQTSLEGGVRVPLIISWPGHTPAGTQTDSIVSNYDFMATMSELTGVSQGPDKDGLSYLQLLQNKPENFCGHDYIVYAGLNGPALLMKDGWKIRCYIKRDSPLSQFRGEWKTAADNFIFELYNIFDDPKENKNLASVHPEILQRLHKLLVKECDGNVIHGTMEPHFAFYGDLGG
ncbi:MAG: sulfatase-like hydrolase/transferase [Treponema sp.]|nr:sulfatase-like hydrolase/transferase [Treponema sp.]